MALGYIFGWTLINVPEMHNIAEIYFLFALIAGLVGVGAAAGAYPFAALGYPPMREILEPTLAGAIFGLFWVLITGQVAWVSQMFQITGPLQLTPLVAYILYGFAIPCTEEILHRAAMLPSFIRLFFNSKTTGILLTSGIFCLSHWVTFGASLAWLVSAFFFSIGLCLLTLHYRTAWVAGVAHMVYNFVVLYSLFGVPF